MSEFKESERVYVDGGSTGVQEAVFRSYVENASGNNATAVVVTGTAVFTVLVRDIFRNDPRKRRKKKTVVGPRG